MPQHERHRRKRALSGLMVLAVFLMSAVQAHMRPSFASQSGLNQVVVAATYQPLDMALGAGHDHAGSPCRGHPASSTDASHCLACGCAVMTGVIPAAAIGWLPVYVRGQPYRFGATQALDNLNNAPATPPPRPVV